jgi:aminopeptidase-like protein
MLLSGDLEQSSDMNMILDMPASSSSGLDSLGLEIYALISDLYPICRSITGDGLRKTLNMLQQYIPLEMCEVPTGTPVFDWAVPKEWNIRDAYIKNPKGEKVVDFQESNLHVLNYSVPIHKTLPLAELRNYLFSLPDYPDWIPYRTSYYRENWGFCLAHRTLQTLEEGDYEVYIDSSLEDGCLTYGEYFIPGTTSDEVLLSCHSCHPSLCNDNLSGIALATFLAKHLSSQTLRYSYRFLFIPGTIGSITWLSQNEHRVPHIKHGLVIAGVGDSGALTYKKSRQGNAEIDRAVTHVLHHTGQDFKINDFSPYGYDERQYCSPGFNLPVGNLGRTPFGAYPEYHTSADNLDFVNPTSLADSFETYLAIIDLLENNRTYLNTKPKGEPQLGKRGLYTTLGGKQTTPEDRMALLWVLNLSDGTHSLLDIAERSGLSFSSLKQAAHALANTDLLKLVSE